MRIEANKMETIVSGQRFESEFTYRVYPVGYIKQMLEQNYNAGRETTRRNFEKLLADKKRDSGSFSSHNDYQKWIWVFENELWDLKEVCKKPAEVLGYFRQIDTGRGDTYELSVNSELYGHVSDLALSICTEERDPRIITFSAISKKETSLTLKVLKRHEHANPK